MLLFVAAAASSALSKHEHEAIAATRDAMCRGVVREMHTEIHKHSLKKNGEDDIFETVPAICLAIVQNYTLTKTPAPSSSWTLLKRAKKLDDEEDGMPDPKSFEHIMTLKKACEAFTDDFQLELSELMYKDTYRKDPDTIIDEFCSMPAIQKKPKKPTAPKKRPPTPPSAPKRRTEPRELPPPPPGQMPGMDELLAKYDTDGSISNLIEMERENPEAMLEPEDLAKVQAGSEQIRCDVCRALSKVALQRAKKAKVLRDEDGLSEIVSDLCVDKPEGSTEYPKYPGNPPLWGEMYRVREQKGRWRLLKLPKGAPMEEASGNSEYNYMVIKHSMIARACKAVVGELEPDLAEVMFARAEWSAKELGEAYCADACSGGAKDEL